MRNLLVLGAFAAICTAPAAAQDAPYTITGNIALATDYTFRGLSQTDNEPSVQGGMDATFGNFYVGAWASNVDFGFSESIELDLYSGYRFPVGPIAMDIGVIAYLYPGASDDGIGAGTGELDYYEGYVKGSFAPAEGVTLGGAAYFSPEFTAETGEAYYVEANGGVALSDMLALSGAVGFQSIDDVSGVFPGSFTDEYTTWNFGGTYTNWGVSMDLRYVGTDVDSADDIITQAFTTDSKADDRVVFSVKRVL